jgi:uncharacterized DUF497 family protein
VGASRKTVYPQCDLEPDKAAENIRRHRVVTFEESQTVFNDPLAVTLSAPEHSEGKSGSSDWAIPPGNGPWL